MDPMVGSSSVVNECIISDSSDNAALLDFCFLCSRQFFHNDLDNYGTERLKDEDILETFFEELGPVDRALLHCCPSCQTLCKTLTRTKEALSSLIDEITKLLLRSRKVSYLLSKSRVVSRLFQSSNLSLPPCEVSSSYLQQPLSQINFSKEISNNDSNNCFPTQFNLRLESSNNLSDVDQLDLALSESNASSFAKKDPSFKSQIINKSACSQEMSATCSSTFNSVYNDSMMNSVSDNACDISEEVNLSQPVYKIMDIDLQNNSSSSNFLKESNTLTITPVVLHPVSNAKDKEAISKCPQNNIQKNHVLKNTNEDADDLNKRENKHVCVLDCKLKEKRTSRRKIKNSTQDNGADSHQHKPSACVKPKKKIRKFKCGLCSKAFQNARNLKSHLDAHNNERKFICEVCGASYRNKLGLVDHVVIHKGEPKFQCNLCLKSFSQKIGLQRHLRIHNRKFEFVCDTCGKQFLHHTSFTIHKLIHAGTKEFGCPHCELTFFQKSNLQRHLKVHTGEKPYTCDLCNRSFSEKYNLLVHIKSHEKETFSAHKCHMCTKTYTRKFKLKQHMKHIHCINIK